MKTKLFLLVFVVLFTTSAYAQKQRFQAVELATEIKGVNGKYINSTSKCDIILEVSDEQISIIKDINSYWKVINKQPYGKDIIYLVRNNQDKTIVMVVSEKEIMLLDEQITIKYSTLQK